MHLRTINLGVNVDWRRPDDAVGAARRFFDHVDAALGDGAGSMRTRRLTTQPAAPDRCATDEAVRCVQRLEAQLGDTWICFPGHQFGSADVSWDQLAYLPEVLINTERTFCNIVVSSSAGMHLGASLLAARMMRLIADALPSAPGNFRFAALANVGPSTPFFPASYHEGADSFAVALELAPLAYSAFNGAGTFVQKLKAFAAGVEKVARAAAAVAHRIERRTGVHFSGIDFSLAPYPGDDQSVVGALETLSESPLGSASFLLSLNAVNRILKTVASDLPRVGYNGTMLSVMEDSVLAERISAREASIKDLLLCSTVCGCGLDMLPTSFSVTVEHLAGLIQSVSVIGQRWRKPLLARLVPAPVDAQGRTRFDHPFLVNTRPLGLDDLQFSAPHPCSDFLAAGDEALAP